jgi:hypothetical protein
VIEHQATWEDVAGGHNIKDKTGRVWRVVEFESTGKNPPESTHFVHMVSGVKKGKILLPPALTPVTIVILSTIELVELELDGTEIT